MKNKTDKTTSKAGAVAESAQVPKIGQIMTVRGKQCQIVRIYAFGTVDVCNLLSGKAYRVIGLPFISENGKY